MQNRPQTKRLAAAALALTAASVNAAPLIGGTEIGIDFGPTAPTNDFNNVNSASGSFTTGSMIDTTATTVDGVGFTWSSSGTVFLNNDAIVVSGTPFNDSNMTDWLGISGGGTNTITLEFTGLDDAMTYDLVIGAAFTNDDANTSWTVDGQTLVSDANDPAEDYRTFTGLSTDGSGNLVMAGTGVAPRADIPVVSAMQLTAVAPPVAETFQLIITPNGDDFDFSWDSQPGKVYDLVTSTDLATPIAEWPPHDPDGEGGNDPFADIPASDGETTALTAVPASGPKRFFAMIEKDAPPLLSEDFETDDGGFTSTATAGTDWARGTPDSSRLGGKVTEGNGGSTNCWGTNLGAYAGGAGDPGFYADPTTDSCLRSPDIDLTGVTGAELTFAEALDVEGDDLAEVKLINAAGDVEIATVYTATDGDISAADWAPANGGIPIDLSDGAGLTVYLQWCLTGTGGGTDDFMGWYIDDVTVTETPAAP